jgi:hypothetical protein
MADYSLLHFSSYKKLHILILQEKRSAQSNRGREAASCTFLDEGATNLYGVETLFLSC